MEWAIKPQHKQKLPSNLSIVFFGHTVDCLGSLLSSGKQNFYLLHIADCCDYVLVPYQRVARYSKTCVRQPPLKLTLVVDVKRWLSYKGICHVILPAKLHDMYLCKTDNFFHINCYLKSVSKVAVLHRFYCIYIHLFLDIVVFIRSALLIRKISKQNMHFGYSLKLPQHGASNKYPHYMIS